MSEDQTLSKGLSEQDDKKASKSKSAVGIVVALLCIALAVFAFIFVQRLPMPKYQKGVIEGSFTEEYYKERVPHDVIFYGDCDVYENYSPIELYEKYGISSYIRGNSEQYMWQTYYMLKDTLRTETPKVVVISVHGL